MFRLKNVQFSGIFHMLPLKSIEPKKPQKPNFASKVAHESSCVSGNGLQMPEHLCVKRNKLKAWDFGF